VVPSTVGHSTVGTTDSRPPVIEGVISLAIYLGDRRFIPVIKHAGDGIVCIAGTRRHQRITLHPRITLVVVSGGLDDDGRN
jgi:hypothetical protein